MLTIDLETARRFILGKQGLWPGRRWRGIQGAEQAMRAIDYLQLDPLQIIARSHESRCTAGCSITHPAVGRCRLPAAQVLRLGRLAGRSSDGRAAALARIHAP